MVELVYNNTKYELIGMTLFEIDYGYNLSLYRLPKDGKPKVKWVFMIKSRV